MAAEIASYAATGRVEAAALIPTFGLMGAEFAAAAVMVTDRHSRDLTDLASRIDALATDLQRSATTYTGADDGSALEISTQQNRVL